MCVSQGRRLFENKNDDFIIESNFDEDEDFFFHILMYILVKLIIDNFSILLSISLMS